MNVEFNSNVTSGGWRQGEWFLYRHGRYIRFYAGQTFREHEGLRLPRGWRLYKWSWDTAGALKSEGVVLKTWRLDGSNSRVFGVQRGSGSPPQPWIKFKRCTFSWKSPLLGVHIGQNPVSGQKFMHIAPIPFFGLDFQFRPYVGDTVTSPLPPAVKNSWG